MSFEEQICARRKYTRLFSLQMEAIVFIILQTVFATPVILKIGDRISFGYSPVMGNIQPRDAFKRVKIFDGHNG